MVSNWKLMFMLTQLTWSVGSRCEICWFVLYGIIIWMHGKHVCGTRLCVARKHTYKQTLLVFAALKEAGFVGKIWKYYHYSVTPNWLSGRILVLLKGNYCQKDISQELLRMKITTNHFYWQEVLCIFMKCGNDCNLIVYLGIT